MIAVLGAGPHGHQIASLLRTTLLYDDKLAGYEPCSQGAAWHPWVVGAAWPQVKAGLVESLGPDICEPCHVGQVVFPGARIGRDVTLGEHVHVGWNAVVAHGATIGDYSTICPGAVISGEAEIEERVFIGANATVIHGGIRIGAGAVVGAGSVVLHDIPSGWVVAGNPAKVLR